MLEQFLLDGVPVEPSNRGQPPANGGTGPSSCLQVPGEALDVGAAGTEQPQMLQMAPARELAQVQLVRVTGSDRGNRPGTRLTPVAPHSRTRWMRPGRGMQVRKFVEEVWNGRNYQAAFGLYGDNYVNPFGTGPASRAKPIRATTRRSPTCTSTSRS
jgi:hypothetical protein